VKVHDQHSVKLLPQISEFLGVFSIQSLKNKPVSIAMLVMSICPHVTTQEQLNRF
jgi:hypothetical protein